MMGGINLNTSDRITKRKRDAQSFTEHHHGGPDSPATPKRRNSGISSTVSSSKHRPSAISSRLERLATPRLSSSWKKPIHRKHSPGKKSDEIQRRIESDSVKICFDSSDEKNSITKTSTKTSWKSQLSPKLSKLISDISPTLKVLDKGDKPTIHEICPEQDDFNFYNGGSLENESQASGEGPGILSMPIIASLLNHPYHSSCPPAAVVKFSVLAFQREVQRLSNELAIKDKYISELQRKAKESDDARHCSERELERLTDELAVKDKFVSELQAKVKENEIARNCDESILYNGIDSDSLVSSIVALESLAPRKSTEMGSTIPEPEPVGYEDCIKSLSTMQNGTDGFNELVIRLSEELDSKLEEIDFMKMEHDIEIQQIRKIVECLTPSPVTPLAKKAPADHTQEVKRLFSSVKRLKEECIEIRRSSIESIRLANSELGKNCKKIMSYVHEEVESAHIEEIGILQSELASARTENTRLELELKEATDKHSARPSCICQQCMNCLPQTQEPSPLPTTESWSHFCMKFRQAIRGNEEISVSEGKQALNKTFSADELRCEDDQEVFFDALCSLSDSKI